MAATQARPEEWDDARPFEDIPGPKPLPIIGNLWRFIPYIGKLLFHYVIMGMLTKLNNIRLFLCANNRLSVQSNPYFTCISSRVSIFKECLCKISAKITALLKIFFGIVNMY
jgi:hypothetical protein